MKKIILTATVTITSLIGFTQQPLPLNQEEKNAILYMREEEKLARDVYEFLYTTWGGNPFGNIRLSEQTHMDRMKMLINTYELTDPVTLNRDEQGVFTNTILQKYYNEFIILGRHSLTDALKTGAKIEELDIKDLKERMKQTQRPDIISIYTELNKASENHLRAFVRRLTMLGEIYEPVILNNREFENIIANSTGNRGSGRAS